MYSLYRAWLSLNHHCTSQLPPQQPHNGLPPPHNGLQQPPHMGDTCHTSAPPPQPPPTSPQQTTPTGSIAPLNLTAAGSAAQGVGALCHTQPDVHLQVGATMTSFSAHRSVLAGHSGWFKAALATHTGPGPILVPNVNVDEFSSLLTFMYTGYLDLNISNIYNTLLATHILHMPRALEICRAYLIQQQPAPSIDHHHPPQLQHQITPSNNIIKPIARPGQMNHQIFTPIYSNLEKSESTPFKVVEKPTSLCQASTSKVTVATTSEKPKVTLTPSKPRKDGNGKVVIDIACCDGPVRFHRVINRNYGNTDIVNNVENAPINKNAALNKVMQENINKQRCDDKTNEFFTCLYCNHTFKSQYCYQKHARRHLNPVNVDSNVATPTGIQKVENTRREVRLLDMNVQYYPCKTCGSKFPSYYFVHKHRKLCHAEEMADNENKNNEIVQVTGNNGGAGEGGDKEREVGQDEETTSSSKNSIIIDVETDGNV